jgi:tetratricopeptide (TPR) repeat protein
MKMSTRALKLGSDQENRLRLQASTERLLAQGRLPEAAASWTHAVELSKVMRISLAWALRTGKVLLERVCLSLEPTAALPLLLGQAKTLEGLGVSGLELCCQVVLALSQVYIQLSNRTQAVYWLTKTFRQATQHPTVKADRASLALSLCKLTAEQQNPLEALQFAQQAVGFAEAQGQAAQRAVGLHNWAVQLERLGQKKQAEVGFQQAVKVLETHGSMEDMALLSQLRQYSSAPNSPLRGPKATLRCSPKPRLVRSPKPLLDRSLQVNPRPDSDLEELDSRGYLEFSRDEERPRSVIRRLRGGKRRPVPRVIVANRKPKLTIQRLQAWIRGWIARKQLLLLRRKRVALRCGRKYESGRYGVVVVFPAWKISITDIQTGQEFKICTTSRTKARVFAKDLAIQSSGRFELRALTRLQSIWKSAITRVSESVLQQLSLNSLPLTKPHLAMLNLPRASSTDTIEPDSLSTQSDFYTKQHTVLPTYRRVQITESTEKAAASRINLQLPQNLGFKAAVAIQTAFRGYIARVRTHLRAHDFRVLYRGARYLQPGVLCSVGIAARGTLLQVNVHTENRYLSLELNNLSLEEIFSRLYVSDQLLLSSELGPFERAIRCIQRWIRGFFARRQYRNLQKQSKRKLAYLAQKSIGAEVYHIALYQLPGKLQIETFKVYKQRQLKYHTYSSTFQLQELSNYYGQDPSMAAIFEDLQLTAGGQFCLRYRGKREEKTRSPSRPRASQRALIRASKSFGGDLWVVTMTRADVAQGLDCMVEFAAYSGGAAEPLYATAQLSSLAETLELPLADILSIGTIAIQRLLLLEQGHLVLDLTTPMQDKHRLIIMLQAHIRGFIIRRKYHIYGHKSGLLACLVTHKLHAEWVFYAYRTPPSLRLVAQRRHSNERSEASIPDTILSQFPPSVTSKRVMEQFIFPQLSLVMRDGQHVLLIGESILTVPKRKEKMQKLAKRNK